MDRSCVAIASLEAWSMIILECQLGLVCGMISKQMMEREKNKVGRGRRGMEGGLLPHPYIVLVHEASLCKEQSLCGS